MSKLESYSNQINSELNIDVFNIKESALKAPARKHFWVSRLIFHKKNILSLEEKKRLLVKDLTKKILDKSPVKITTPVAEKSALQTEDIKKIDLELKEEKNIVEYLEKTEKIYSSLTYDIKNIVEIMKLEQL